MAEITIKKMAPGTLVLLLGALAAVAFMGGGRGGLDPEVVERAVDLFLLIKKKGGDIVFLPFARGVPERMSEILTALESIMSRRQARGDAVTGTAEIWSAKADPRYAPQDYREMPSNAVRLYKDLPWYGTVPEHDRPVIHG